jgi:predicted RNase H-like HicB family nuclease
VNEKYRIEIEHDGEEWVVRFPQLRGCAGRHILLEEALLAAEIAQEEYLERFERAKSWPNLL